MLELYDESKIIKKLLVIKEIMFLASFRIGRTESFSLVPAPKPNNTN